MVNKNCCTEEWCTEDISAYLDIGPQFLLLSTIACSEKIKCRGISRDPESLPLQSHFIHRKIIPASLIVEFSLQFSAFVVRHRDCAKSTPIIGDLRYRALAPAFSLESLTIEVDSYRNLGSGAVISSIVYDQSAEIIGRSTYTYSVA